MKNEMTYQPEMIEELQEMLREAGQNDLSVRTSSIGDVIADEIQIDFQRWNRIREIDTINLTVTAERSVTFGALEAAVQPYGLHMAAMTDDLKHITLGDFFGEQYTCLTTNRYNQPRYQILGLEVMLADGTVLQVAGKTVKNVTGYDMCRFYISSRETLAIPLAFTIKLVSQQPMQAVMEALISDTTVLKELVRRLRQKHLCPEACLYWNDAAAQQIDTSQLDDADGGRLLLVCSGSLERLQHDLVTISEIAEMLEIDMNICKQPEVLWQVMEQLRQHTQWHDALKVPALTCDALLNDLAQRGIGCWCNLLQGNIQLMMPNLDSREYQEMCREAERLGGCGNWFYQYQFGFPPLGETRVWQQLKQKFDVADRLNPIKLHVKKIKSIKINEVKIDLTDDEEKENEKGGVQ